MCCWLISYCLSCVRSLASSFYLPARQCSCIPSLGDNQPCEMGGDSLKEHLVQCVPSRQTRSAASPLLSVPRLTTDFARRSFSYTAPVIWNSLPSEVILCDSEHSFKRHLRHSCLTTVTRPSDRHLTSASVAFCRHTSHFLNLLIIIIIIIIIITRHMLVERRARYLFYCMFVCLFGQRFLSNPRADSRHICMRA